MLVLIVILLFMIFPKIDIFLEYIFTKFEKLHISYNRKIQNLFEYNCLAILIISIVCAIYFSTPYKYNQVIKNLEKYTTSKTINCDEYKQLLAIERDSTYGIYDSINDNILFKFYSESYIRKYHNYNYEELKKKHICKIDHDKFKGDLYR